MTGSPLAGVIIPVVTVIVLAAWLARVFYADAHPGHAAGATAAEHGIASETTSGDARQRDERQENASGGDRESSPEEQDGAHSGGRSTRAAPERPAT